MTKRETHVNAGIPEHHIATSVVSWLIMKTIVETQLMTTVLGVTLPVVTNDMTTAQFYIDSYRLNIKCKCLSQLRNKCS